MGPTPNADTTILLLYALAAVATISWLWGGRKDPVPALIGADGRFLSSYRAAFQFLVHSSDIVRAGYAKQRDGVFRFPRLFRWDYIANGVQRIGEVAAAPDDVLSFKEGVGETLQVAYLMGAEIEDDPYHHHTVRTTLTRNLGRCLPEVKDEIVCAFSDVLPLENDDWKPVTLLPSMMRIIARTTNRLFVGLPLCRNEAYLNISIAYTVAVFTRGAIINLFPPFLRPIVGRLMSPKEQALRDVLKFLGPIISDRLAKEDELGPNWPDKPNDLISWLMQDAGPGRTVPGLARRVLITNMAAIHTSTMAIVDVLFDLAAYPSHISALREEVERVVREEGWSKGALNNMHKVDSFIRESQRTNGAGPLSLTRKVVAKDGFRFSDGTFIPYGSFLSVSGRPVQHDPANYDNPEVFDGFRFSRLREQGQEAGEGIFKNHMVSTAPEHLVFGHGKHACPGRFFAATELKTILAHVLLTYDVKSDIEGVRPPSAFGGSKRANPAAKIWIRKRQ
ncbi:cytochrome P450 [Mycena latifolia]|nr:cytochrome P450 [Mycena latifolia]